MQTETLNLEQIRQAYQKTAEKLQHRIIVCAGTGCVANGSLKVFEAIRNAVEAKGLSAVVSFESCGDNGIHLSKSGCQGFCQMGPLVTVEPEGILYVKVKAADAEEIIQTTLI